MFRTFPGASPRPGPKSSLDDAFARPSNFTLRAYGCMANLSPNRRLKPRWFPSPSPEQVTNDQEELLCLLAEVAAGQRAVSACACDSPEKLPLPRVSKPANANTSARTLALGRLYGRNRDSPAFRRRHAPGLGAQTRTISGAAGVSA